MGLGIKVVKGMKDILPAEIHNWQYLEHTFFQLLNSYGYSEIRSPLLEQTALFKRAIGQVTDIVEKEMYTLEDKGGDLLSLRPEGTAQCVRAAIENGLLHNQTQKLWYIGPMFRRERPQKGRLRQFFQLGVEAFGFAGPDVDIELLFMTARLWEQLGIRDAVQLEINSLGTYDERQSYRAVLVDYFNENKDLLDEDSVNRLSTNPLRILDSKNPSMQDLIQSAPSMLDFLGAESKQHFDTILAALEQAQIPYKLNTRLVRGLDYYTHTVFEWTSDLLGAQSAVCAGGRYDSLVELIGGKPTASTGFALGIERLLMLLEEKQALPKPKGNDVYIIHDDLSALNIAEAIRTACPDLSIVCHCGQGSFKSQIKKADKSGSKWAIIQGEEERSQNKLTLKSLREDKPQQLLSLDKIIDELKQIDKNSA